MNASAEKRLMELRRRGDPGVAPLWLTRLAPEELLPLVEGRDEPWAKLLLANALADLGRGGEAKAALAGFAGGGRLLRELKAKIEARIEEISSAKVFSAILALEIWLKNVRAWRVRAGR